MTRAGTAESAGPGTAVTHIPQPAPPSLLTSGVRREAVQGFKEHVNTRSLAPPPAAPHLPVRRRRVRTVVALVLLVAGVFTAAAPASAVDTGTLGIRPANESDFFHLSLYPGAATDAAAVVSNHTSAPVTLLNYPVDGQTTAQGTFAFASQTDPKKSVGAWVHLNTDHITIPANTDLNVPFRLTVPPGTPPGDYAGGLIIQAPPVQGKTTTVNGDTAVRLDVIQRQGVRIYLNVAGTAVKALTHDNLTWQHDGDNITFTLPVHNTGNTILHPKADLNLTGWPANVHLSFDTPESLLPGASLDLHARLTGAPIAENGASYTTLASEAGTTQSTGNVFYAPWILITASILFLAAAAYGTWRGIRFIRRARAALAQLNNPRPTPLAPARTNVPEPNTPSDRFFPSG